MAIKWIIKSTGVLPDGLMVTATNLLTRTGPNTARWASTERTVAAGSSPTPASRSWSAGPHHRNRSPGPDKSTEYSRRIRVSRAQRRKS